MDNQQRLEAALQEARSGNSAAALGELEELVRSNNQPQVLAWLGFCLAKEKQDFSRALVLCTSALDTAPDKADIYLALGRVYRLAGRRYQARSSLRKGLKLGRHELLAEELQAMGRRKEPVFSSLDREHPLNALAGRVLTRLRFR